MSERIAVTRRGDLGMIALRCAPAEPGLAGALVGCAPPAPRRIETGGGGAVAWMSPDELMLLVPRPEVGARLAGIAAALAGAHYLAVDVSDARALFRLEGAGAREVLAKGAPVDLAPETFGPGDFRRTRLGQVACAFWMPEARVFELICFRSVADFVERWLVTAAAPEARPGVFRDA